MQYLESQGPPWWIRDEREETRRSVPWNPRARAEYRKEPTQPLANVESHALELNTARGRSGRDKRERLKR